MKEDTGARGRGCVVSWILALILWFVALVSIILVPNSPWVAGIAYIAFTVMMFLHYTQFRYDDWKEDVWIKVYVASVIVAGFLGFVFSYQVFISKSVSMFDMGWIPVVQGILMVGSLLALGNFGPPKKKKTLDSQ
jgi:hypothetical protein